jgi:hypothetical protein
MIGIGDEAVGGFLQGLADQHRPKAEMELIERLVNGLEQPERFTTLSNESKPDPHNEDPPRLPLSLHRRPATAVPCGRQDRSNDPPERGTLDSRRWLRNVPKVPDLIPNPAFALHNCHFSQQADKFLHERKLLAFRRVAV